MRYMTVAGFIMAVAVLDGDEMAIPKRKDGIGLT